MAEPQIIHRDMKPGNILVSFINNSRIHLPPCSSNVGPGINDLLLYFYFGSGVNWGKGDGITRGLA